MFVFYYCTRSAIYEIFENYAYLYCSYTFIGTAIFKNILFVKLYKSTLLSLSTLNILYNKHKFMQ